MRPVLPYQSHGKTSQEERNYRPVSFTNMDVKNPQQNIGNWIQQHIKRIIQKTIVGLSQECKVGSIYKKSVVWHTIINRIMGENPHDHLSRYRKSIWWNPTPFMMKTFNRLGIEKNFLNLVKGIYEKSLANLLDGEAESCTPGSGTTPALTISGQHGIRGSKQDNWARKEIKGTHVIKEVKLSFLIVGRTFYIKNHIKLFIFNEFSQLVGWRSVYRN